MTINKYNIIRNKPIVSQNRIKARHADLVTCKQLCDSFDECHGFMHDEINHTCDFYGSDIQVDTYQHYGHMASYLKEGAYQENEEDLNKFIERGIDMIEINGLRLEESLSKMRQFNKKVFESMFSTKYHLKWNSHKSETSNYFRKDNMILNVDYKNADPVKNYHLPEEVSNDAIELYKVIRNSDVDLLRLLLIHDVIIVLWDRFTSDEKNEAIERFKKYHDELLGLLSESLRLLTYLKTYRRYIQVRQKLEKMQNSIFPLANDIAETYKSLKEDQYILPAQIITAKLQRSQESLEKIEGNMYPLQIFQGEIFSLDFKLLPDYDIKRLQKLNNMIVMLFAKSRNKYNKILSLLDMEIPKLLEEQSTENKNKRILRMGMYGEFYKRMKSIILADTKKYTLFTNNNTSINTDAYNVNDTNNDLNSLVEIPEQLKLLKTKTHDKIANIEENEEIPFVKEDKDINPPTNSPPKIKQKPVQKPIIDNTVSTPQISEQNSNSNPNPPIITFDDDNNVSVNNENVDVETLSNTLNNPNTIEVDIPNNLTSLTEENEEEKESVAKTITLISINKKYEFYIVKDYPAINFSSNYNDDTVMSNKNQLMRSLIDKKRNDFPIISNSNSKKMLQIKTPKKKICRYDYSYTENRDFTKMIQYMSYFAIIIILIFATKKLIRE